MRVDHETLVSRWWAWHTYNAPWLRADVATEMLTAHYAQFPNVPVQPVMNTRVVGENVEFYVTLEPVGGMRGWLAAEMTRALTNEPDHN